MEMQSAYVGNSVQVFSSFTSCLSIPSVSESVHTFASHKSFSKMTNPQPLFIRINLHACLRNSNQTSSVHAFAP